MVGCLNGKRLSGVCTAGSTLVDSATPARAPLLGPRLCLGGRFDPDGAPDEGSAVDIV